MSFKVNPSVADIRKKYKAGDLLQLWHTGLSGMAMPVGVWRLTPRGLVLAESTHGQEPGITWGEFQRLFKMDNGYSPGIAKVKRIAVEAAYSNPRKRRHNPDTFQVGDVVHYLQGWDAKKHPTVTGTILQRYFRGDGDEWLVESPSPYTGEMERTAVRAEKLKHGPAPVKVLSFARANPRKRRNPVDAEDLAYLEDRMGAAKAALARGDKVSALAAQRALRSRMDRVRSQGQISKRAPWWELKDLTESQAERLDQQARDMALDLAINPRRRRNPDLSGALTIAHEASGDVVIRHVAHNPGKRRNPALSPDRYISVLTDHNSGVRLWQVMGHGGLPETRAGDKDDAIWSFKRFDKSTKDANIPVWDGNLGVFTTIGAAQARANPARGRAIDKSSPKRRRNPSARVRPPHPEWVQHALKAGAKLLEGGEHGFYSVQVGKHWATEADTPEGELTVGTGSKEVAVLPEMKAIGWLASKKTAKRKNPGPAHAAPTVSAATLAKIARMTGENDHSGALLVLARDVLKSPTFAKKALGIQLAHNRAGYLTEALAAKRSALSARMFAQAKRRLSAADYALLRRSF